MGERAGGGLSLGGDSGGLGGGCSTLGAGILDDVDGREVVVDEAVVTERAGVSVSVDVSDQNREISSRAWKSEVWMTSRGRKGCATVMGGGGMMTWCWSVDSGLYAAALARMASRG